MDNIIAIDFINKKRIVFENTIKTFNVKLSSTVEGSTYSSGSTYEYKFLSRPINSVFFTPDEIAYDPNWYTEV
jgi:hypothetical protein